MRKKDILKKHKKKKTLRQIRKENQAHLKSERHQYKKFDEPIKLNSAAIIKEAKKDDNIIKKEEAKADNSISDKPNKKINNGTSRPKGKKITFVLSILVSVVTCICIVVGCICLKFAYDMLQNKPELNVDDLRSPNSSLILDKDGNVVMELGLYLRENIDYEDMPNCLIDAFLSIEDSRFFSHFGFDIPRFTMAAIENLRAGDFGQGGSTITMQLIKNTYFQIDDDENSTMADRDGLAGIRRKLQEIVLSIELNSEISKQETMALFLNKINFGNNIRGVEKAAQYYFGKSASELNLSESAFLAGIINSPNNYNPYNDLYKDNPNYIYLNPDIEYLSNATARRNEVLDLMVYHGYITKEEAELAKSVKMEDLLAGIGEEYAQTNKVYQSYIDAVIDEVIEETGESPYNVPMIIYTNMDPYMQELLHDIQNDNTDINFRLDSMQSAIVIMNNQTGDLIALSGGRGQNESRMFNRATSAYIQPGSTIKPIFEYALAFEYLGWATSHTITDQPIWLYNSNHLIRNAGGQAYTGDMLLTEAVARSLNTPAIQTLQAVIDEIGEDACVDYLRSIGFDVDYEDFDLQFAIGGNKLITTPVQLGAAHGMLINEGYYVKPHTINHIEYFDGRDDYVADTQGTQVLSSGAAYLSAYLEEYNVSGPYFNYMQILRSDYPVYAKTGTTDWGDSGLAYGIPRGAAKDSWLVCQTSDYTATIWLGFDKAAKGTYFTTYDDNYNAKGRIGRLILDTLEEHYDYNPRAIEQPDEVTKITHIKGLFPYCYPDRGSSVTGLILDKYNKLVSADTIELKTKVGSLTGMGGTIDSSGNYTIYWYGYGSSNGDTMDISATNMFGKTEHAFGRCYYPRYTYIGASNYYATISVNGNTVSTIESSSPSYSGSISYEPGQTVQVCGWTSNGEGEKCATIK